MISLCFAVVLAQQAKVVAAPVSTWDGKAWAGVAIGVSEKDLRKQFSTSKTITADPASIRLNSDDKQMVVTAVLTDVNQRGSVAGICLERERNEPLFRLADLKQQLNESDSVLFPRVRYGDWSLLVWREKGIAAVVSRDSVLKVMLASPPALQRNLNVWESSPTMVRATPRIPVRGFDVTASSDPTDAATDQLCRQYLQVASRRLMDTYDGSGWTPDPQGSARIRVSLRVTRKKEIGLEGSVSLLASDDLGTVSVSDTVTDSVKTDMEAGFRSALIFEELMARLSRSIDEKYRLLTWQTEWRPFYALAR